MITNIYKAYLYLCKRIFNVISLNATFLEIVDKWMVTMFIRLLSKCYSSNLHNLER